MSISVDDLQDMLDKVIEERDRYRKAIEQCLDTANNREQEWGSRAESAFKHLHQVLENTTNGR